MKVDDKFKNIKTRTNKSLVDQLMATAERGDHHRTEEQLRKQLRECAVLAYELQQRMKSDGEGLPPVGCECEFSLHLFGATSEWEKCEFLARNDKRGVSLILTKADYKIVFDSDQPRFRPIRTKEQQQRDELIKVMEMARKESFVGDALSVCADAILSRYNLEPKK